MTVRRLQSASRAACLTAALLLFAAMAHAADEQPRVYLVQLREPAALPAIKAERHAARRTARGRVDPRSRAVRARAAELGATQEAVLATVADPANLVYSYRLAFNGFAARLTPQQAAKLARHGGVARVWADEVRQLKSNASSGYLGLTDAGTGLRANRGLRGENVVIGVIDSGIATAHPSFNDRVQRRPRLCRSEWARNSLLGRWLCRRFANRFEVVYEPLDGWQGACETGPGFPASECNRKLIGARFYNAGFAAVYGTTDDATPWDDNEFLSPRDADGHGTHIASVAAGNTVKADLGGTEVASIGGIAPRARIAVYKACWLLPGAVRASCAMSDLQGAIEDAVADGVDIISYAIGTTAGGPADPDAIALLEASDAGILAVVAAGNSGSTDTGTAYGTIESPASAPWVMAVAASSRAGTRYDRALQVTAPAAARADYTMREAAFTPTLRSNGPVSGKLVGADPANGCSTLDNAADVDGEVALIAQGDCDFQAKVRNAEQAGATAVVVYSNSGAPVQMIGRRGSVQIPAVMISRSDGEALTARLDDDEALEVTLDAGRILARADAGGRMYDKSSRGPNPAARDILKPDVTAPGVDILGAQTSAVANGLRGERYQYLSGTSMAVPQVAGVAALLKEAHPEWSPAALRSAMVTTGRQDITVVNDGVVESATPFDVGGGHLAPNPAVAPGLVYDAGSADYDAFACGAGIPRVSEEECLALEAQGYALDADGLNLPSVTVSGVTGERTVRRRVTNVGAAGTWQASVVAPPGVEVDVQPATLTLDAGETGEFTVTVANTGDADTLQFWSFGSLSWVNGAQRVRSPLVTLTSPLAAPDSISASGASGTTSFDVQFGYAGSYNVGSTNLAAPAAFAGSVYDALGLPYVYSENDGDVPNYIARQRIVVAADTRYLRIALNSNSPQADDLDLLLTCPGGCPGADAQLVSAGESSDEYVDILNPEAGEYVIDVYGFSVPDAGGSPFLLRAWGVTDTGGEQPLLAAGPGSATVGGTGTVTLEWTGLGTNEVYLALLSHDDGAEVIGQTLVEIVVPE